MNLIKPNKLKIGDTISIIAPSGVVDFDKIIRAKDFFIKNGYNVELGKNLQCKQNYLAGSDDERLEDLHTAFCDNNVKAVVCARGGYGALRLADKINFELIKNNPKIFFGYSDATILNALFLKNAGLITFSGPMAQSDFGNNVDSFTKKYFFEAINGNLLEISPIKSKIYKSGNASGLLFGGNLATLVSLCGCDFIPDEDFIFFVEDLNEPSYKIDRYFTQLLRIEKFRNNIKAIILGDFLELDNEIFFDNYFKNLALELNIPIISGYPISHNKAKVTIPYGAKCTLYNSILTIKDYLA